MSEQNSETYNPFKAVDGIYISEKTLNDHVANVANVLSWPRVPGQTRLFFGDSIGAGILPPENGSPEELILQIVPDVYFGATDRDQFIERSISVAMSKVVDASEDFHYSFGPVAVSINQQVTSALLCVRPKHFGRVSPSKRVVMTCRNYKSQVSRTNRHLWGSRVVEENLGIVFTKDSRIFYENDVPKGSLWLPIPRYSDE